MCSCVEILINEQTRCYNQKMEEIQQLEDAEAIAIKQLKLRRQNTVREASHASLQYTTILKIFLKRTGDTLNWSKMTVKITKYLFYK